MRFFAHPPVIASAGSPTRHPLQNLGSLAVNWGILGRFCDGGILGYTGVGSGEKNILILIFFDFFPTFLYSKKSSIKLLFIYVYIYLIYVEGGPEYPGIFFFLGGHPNSRVRQEGRWFPRLQHIWNFFDAAG
jgi:hypothetical protein